MKVLHLTASLDSEHGGPVTVVRGLAQALAKKGIDVSLFAPSKKAKCTHTSDYKGVTARVFPTSFFSKFWPCYSPTLKKALKNELSNFDIIHVHEIWHYPNFACYQVTKATRKPYLVAVHGALEPSCLNHKAFKKKIYSKLIQREILENAAALHAITEEEVKSIAEFVDNKNIYCVPNGLNVEDFENLPGRSRLESLYPQIKGKRVILFLGRIHPKKGLDLLAQAFGRVAGEQGNVCLLIAGPNNDGYRTQVEKILAAEGVSDKVIFTGMLTGSERLAALSGADIFALPSHSEGFSMSILEAMACGLPVIITKDCHFQEVEQMQAGKVIDGNLADLSEALIQLLADRPLCMKMGSAGKKLVKDKYTWDKAADKMIGCYEEILNGQRIPGTQGK
jgi:glycosyltransferase involved in cell wall biosynthesis